MSAAPTPATIEIPVLICGGGPVGLTLSLLLSRYGIHSLLVERHPGTATLPKARGLNGRTMEMFRQLGLETEIRSAGAPADFTGMVIWAESLAGTEISRRVRSRASGDADGVGPAENCLCSQDMLEPVLRAHAERAAPGALRFGTELVDVVREADGVSGILLDKATGARQPVRARYLLAADGAASRLRGEVGIGQDGTPNIYDSVNVHCRVDLRPWIADRPASLYYIEQPDLRATFLTINGADRWGFLVHSIKQYGFTPDTLTPERCATLIRQAVGTPDLPVEVLGIGFWQCSAMVSKCFRAGPVFLVGDAAHETTPSGGFGLNIGVQDAQNLAWKFAAVLQGQADPVLLDSYDAERRPTTAAVVHTTLLNMQSLGRDVRQDKAQLPRAQYLNETGMIFGACYNSSAVVGDGTAPPSAADPTTDYIPSAHPGCRAPHLWLSRDGSRVSVLDELGAGFVLLTGDPDWRGACVDQAAPVRPVVIGPGGELADPEGRWAPLYGVDPGGAVLVRPDGHVGWRCARRPADMRDALTGALGVLLGNVGRREVA